MTCNESCFHKRCSASLVGRAAMTQPRGISRMLSLCRLEVFGNASLDLRTGLVQLFISHQTYGHKKHKEEADQDIRSLIWRFRQYPIYLVCSLHAIMR